MHLRPPYRHGWQGQDRGASGTKMLGWGLWEDCRPLTSPGLPFQMGILCHGWCGPDPPSVLHLRSCPKAPTHLLLLSSLCQVTGANTYFLKSIKKWFKIPPFPGNSYIRGTIKKTLQWSEERFTCKDGKSVRSGLCLDVGRRDGCAVSPTHRCAGRPVPTGGLCAPVLSVSPLPPTV